MSSIRPIPPDELERLLNLSEYNIDFANIQNNFSELNKLAASIAGTDISLINLIDCYTQWTVSSYGLEMKQMPRDESVCQYTIMKKGGFEVPNLSSDDRFKDFDYVKGELGLKYYYGIPLTTVEGFNIGALCVMHPETRLLSDEKIAHLTIIADEIVNRLRAIKVIEKLKLTVKESTYTQKKIVHDIRGPIAGIIGLADIIIEQGYNNDMDEVLEYMNLVKNSGDSIVSLANEILTAQQQADSGYHESFNLLIFKEKLEQLYLPPSIKKNIDFTVSTSKETELWPVSKFNLMQIAGNLVSNAIKFTPEGGSIRVQVDLEIGDIANLLQISVSDTGIGLSPAQIDLIMGGKGKSTSGTGGEDGFGFGLAMVKNLIDSMHGELKISSAPGQGTCFEVILLQH
ncbi:GAF domain-containing sensor histidine kinase [Paradesertivirga mongoliensis]|uniref:histidine kinase n=1 Tax=Paradesertivirga mongoliensis TaxID=2100740 RepID=A0ABW4ZJ55_9SPHI|nr:GAF domain-containing sensor histidine kinase [Pedobacter mongoliensis]